MPSFGGSKAEDSGKPCAAVPVALMKFSRFSGSEVVAAMMFRCVDVNYFHMLRCAWKFWQENLGAWTNQSGIDSGRGQLQRWRTSHNTVATGDKPLVTRRQPAKRRDGTCKSLLLNSVNLRFQHETASRPRWNALQPAISKLSDCLRLPSSSSTM